MRRQLGVRHIAVTLLARGGARPALIDELLPHRESRARAIPSACHQRETVGVSLGLQIPAEPGSRHHDGPVDHVPRVVAVVSIRVERRGRGRNQRGLSAIVAIQIEGMPAEIVPGLVRQHGSQLCLVANAGQQTRVHDHHAGGEHCGIERRVAHHVDAQVRRGPTDQPFTDTPDIGIELRRDQSLWRGANPLFEPRQALPDGTLVRIRRLVIGADFRLEVGGQDGRLRERATHPHSRATDSQCLRVAIIASAPARISAASKPWPRRLPPGPGVTTFPWPAADFVRVGDAVMPERLDETFRDKLAFDRDHPQQDVTVDAVTQFAGDLHGNGARRRTAVAGVELRLGRGNLEIQHSRYHDQHVRFAHLGQLEWTLIDEDFGKYLAEILRWSRSGSGAPRRRRPPDVACATP